MASDRWILTLGCLAGCMAGEGDPVGKAGGTDSGPGDVGWTVDGGDDAGSGSGDSDPDPDPDAETGTDSGPPDTGADTGAEPGPLDAEVCDNGFDDDWTGFADCGDAACAEVGSCSCVDTDAGATVGTLWTGALAGAGDELQGPCTSQVGGEEVMLLWTPVEDGCYELSTEGSDFDTTLAVGAGYCGGPMLACNDDAPGSVQSRVTVSAHAGRTLMVVAEGYDRFSTGDLVVVAAAGEPFAARHDTDAGSVLGDAVATGDLGTATARVDHSCATGTEASALVLWTAPESGTYSFTSTGSDFDAVVSIFGQCATALTCDDYRAGDHQGDARVLLSEGDTVHVAIGGAGGETGSWVLNVSGPTG